MNNYDFFENQFFWIILDYAGACPDWKPLSSLWDGCTAVSAGIRRKVCDQMVEWSLCNTPLIKAGDWDAVRATKIPYSEKVSLEFRDHPLKTLQEFCQTLLSMIPPLLALENQLDLDADLPSHPPTNECEHRWERVLIATGSLNAFMHGYACSRCGAEKYEDRFDRQDFDAWNAGKTYRRSKLPPQPQCEIQTTRGHQCIHPCQPGKRMCLRHLNQLKQPYWSLPPYWQKIFDRY